MNERIDAILLWLVIVAIAGVLGTLVYTVVTQEPVRVFYYGSENVEHDTDFGGMVNTNVSYGLYCSDPALLIPTPEGSIYITGRGGSADNCGYVNESLLGIAVVGWQNVDEHVVESPDNSLSISQGGTWGAAYGTGVDYYVPAGSLSEAMPLMANILLEILAATSSPLSTHQMKEILNAASDGMHTVDGKDYGLKINLERSIDYAANGIPPPPPAEPCTDCGYLPAQYYLLLLDE